MFKLSSMQLYAQNIDILYRAVFLSEHFVVKAIRNETLILLAEIVRKEIADIHDISVVFTGEPSSALPHLVPADVSAVATWRFPSCFVVPTCKWDSRKSDQV